MVVDTQVRKLTEEWWIEERMASLEERLVSKGSSVAALLQCTEKEVRQIMDSIGVPSSEPYMPALKQIKKAVDQEAKRDAPPPRWVRQCHVPFGRSMRPYISDDGRTWDTYTLARILQVHLRKVCHHLFVCVLFLCPPVS